MNILNSKEAFDAMMAGRNIMCRAVGELMDFDDLSQFPATIFAMPGYEFCIKVETMELAGITFAKPLKLEEVREGQDVYVINTYGSSIYVVEFGKMTCTALIESINNGFAQHDAENAKLQLQAISKVLGREKTGDCLVVRLGDKEKPKKKRRSRKAKEDTEQVGIPAGPGNFIPNIEKQPELEVIQPVEAIAQENTFGSQSNIQITEQGSIAIAEDGLIDDLIETDPVKLVEKFTAQIDQFTNPDDVLSFRHVFLANGHLDQKDQQHLCKLTEDKLLELNPEQYMPKVEQPSENLSVTELQRLQHEAEKLVQNKGQDEEYQSLLTDLMDRASKANTPAEANALVGYTKAWSEEQRKPLIDAIHKRLVELNKADAQPSLAVRIQRAEDLTELDALEIDVSACDEVIQPRLMELIEQRRIQLDQISATSEAQ